MTPVYAQIQAFCERIVAINLPYKPERRAALTKNLSESGIARPDDIVWTKAISGDSCPPPSWWGAGNGAWGCLMSHVRAVQDAMMDGVETLCLLEDDVIFHSHATKLLGRLFQELPADWDQVYLGGQHLKEAEDIPGKSFVWRARNINRTHAFILRRKVFGRFLQHVMNATDYIEHPGWHIDHQLGFAHECRLWNTYTPAWWLCGQDAGCSNISGRENPRKWWQPHRYRSGLPFIILPADASNKTNQQLRSKVHAGWNLKDGSFQDVGLHACVNHPEKLRKWLDMIAAESLDVYRVPALQHPKITLEEIRSAWPAGVHHLVDVNLDDLLNYPFNDLFSHPMTDNWHDALKNISANALAV